MRAENDHVFGNSVVESCKDDCKPHQCVEEKWEDAAEIKTLENGKKNDKVCELFYDTRSGDEWDKEGDGNALECHSCVDSNEAGKDSVEKVDPVFYMDKNVTACDLPEIVVCYKENTYHVVKDICVDDGVPVQEKFLFGEKDSVKSSSEDLMKAESANVNPVEETKVEDPKKTNRDAEEEFADAQGSSNCDQEHLHTQGLNPFLEIESDENSKEEEEVATWENSSKESLTLGDILSREDLEEESPSQLEVEEKRSLETTAVEREEAKKAEENLCSTISQEDKVVVSGIGETSFSGGEAVSGHITYSGPIVYSGSLSVRSDASTTSGRSFAFPILQSEWNTSPVRMAKADKRRQKGWRHSLLCCRFS